MAKQLLLTLCIVCAGLLTQAQSISSVKESKTLTFYGIDFSETRFLNFGAYLSDKQVKNGLARWSMHPFGGDDVRAWSKKYKKDKFIVNDAQSAERNAAVNYDERMGTKPFEMSEDDVKELVSQYDIEGNGYGLLYVVECFDNQKTKKGSIWVVFINQADRSIIGMKKFTNDTYGDWLEATRLTLKQSSRYWK